MSKVTVAILVLCAVAVYYVSEAEAENNCKAPVPSDAKFHKSDGKCKGVKMIKGEPCCCRCNGNPKARGYYCNKDYCKKKGASTTAGTSGTTSASGATDSTTGGSSGTTSSSGSSDSTTGGSSGTSGSSDSTTSGSSDSTTSGSSSDSTTSSSDGSS